MRPTSIALMAPVLLVLLLAVVARAAVITVAVGVPAVVVVDPVVAAVDAKLFDREAGCVVSAVRFSISGKFSWNCTRSIHPA